MKTCPFCAEGSAKSRRGDSVRWRSSRSANKMVRICWKVLTSDEEFRAYPARVV